MGSNDMNDEDEDVIIKGTPLYEHLQKLGYTDFESVAIKRTVPEAEVKSNKISDFIHDVKNIFRKLYITFLKIVQDDSVSKKQVETILNAKVLLNDHGCTINNLLDKYTCKPWRTVILKFVLFSTFISSTVYISYNTRYRNSVNVFTLSILCWAGYIERLRINAHTDLKSVVSLQNDLYDLCKKGMKILRYGYKIKLSKEKSSEQFFDLTADRLKHIQPLLENLIKHLEHVSSTYYHASLVLIRLLPVDCYEGDLLTRFNEFSFQICGEINYKKLKTLYYIYILTQSEMLRLLAIAYDNHTWRQSYKKVPELSLAYIICLIITRLIVCKNKLSRNINAYYSFKPEPTPYHYKNPLSTRWQDLYMHLHIASNKLQVAYSYILSILQDIDNDVLENISDENPIENTEKKLNAAQKSIVTAKDFVEFSSLFLIKAQINSTNNRMESIFPTSVSNIDTPVVINSEPEIMDEVFEEYIKEEYLKPLREETDEILLYNYKRDKTLFKNFLTELKDALVDKKKSMSERESKALERMYKVIVTEPESVGKDSGDSSKRIPTPPPMPSFNNTFSLQTDNEVSKSSNKIIKENLIRKNMDDTFIEEKSPITAIPLPRNIEFSLFSLPPFLKTEEETFIGSGENSEDDEIITDK